MVDVGDAPDRPPDGNVDDNDAGGAVEDDRGHAAGARERGDETGVGGFIRHQRELAEMSVRRLADLADVSNPYLSQVERGLRKPSAAILQQVANALKISVETLYVKAGILPDDQRRVSTVPEAIQADPDLNDDQKRALLNVYESFRAS